MDVADDNNNFDQNGGANNTAAAVPSPFNGSAAGGAAPPAISRVANASAAAGATTTGYDADGSSFAENQSIDTLGLPYDATPNSGGVADDSATMAVSLMTDDFGATGVASSMAADGQPLKGVSDDEEADGVLPTLPPPRSSSLDDAEIAGRKDAIKGDIYFDGSGGEEGKNCEGDHDEEEVTAYTGDPALGGAGNDLEGGGTRGASLGLKDAPEKDEHVHEVVEGEGDLSDQPKGTTPASSDVIEGTSGAIRGEGEMVSAYVSTTITENSIPSSQPGVRFVPGPDFRGGIHTGYHSAHEDSDADADINGDIENQTQTLIEAYTVPDNDEQAEIIDKLHEQLGSARQELEVARAQLEVPVVEGVPVSDIEDVPMLDNNKKRKRLMTIGVVLFLGTVAVVVGLAVFFTNQNDNGDEPQAAAQVHPPVLEALQERKVLRCGTHKQDGVGFSALNNETNEREGFEVDLCKAVAAAALGSSYRYELVPVTPVDRFLKLANGEFDVLIAATTHTFDRDVHEVSSGMGYSFSTPYLYGGMTFNGVPEFVTCADKLSVIGDCANIRICSQQGTTWYYMTKKLFPASNIVITVERDESIKNLIEGKCNVIQGEQYEAPEPVVRALGYDGPYAQGVNSFTKEPLAMATRDGDPEFADFVELVLQSLLHAEAQNVTMMTAGTFAHTGEFFGDEYEDMFNPFGKVDAVGPGPIKGGVIESILDRGFLRCGIPLRHSNSPSVVEDAQEPTSDERVGLDMEFCQALSASILQRAPDNVSFKSFPASEYGNISLALENGEIDVYAGGEVNMNSNILSPGLSFSRPYFYEGGPSTSRGNSTVEKAFSLVTQEADAQWTNLVYWVVMATIDAEENGITQMTSHEMPLVSLFGTGLERLLRDAILAVGNYDEMYRRVFGQNTTRLGRNMLNASPFGPEHYPLPFGKRLPDTDESR